MTKQSISAVCAFLSFALCFPAYGADHAGGPLLRPDVSSAVLQMMAKRAEPRDGVPARLYRELVTTEGLLAQAAKTDVLSEQARMGLDGQIAIFTDIRREFSRQHQAVWQESDNDQKLIVDRLFGNIDRRFADLLTMLRGAKSTNSGVRKANLDAARNFIRDARTKYESGGTTTFAPTPQRVIQEPLPSVKEPTATGVPAFIATWHDLDQSLVALNGDFGAVLPPVAPASTVCNYTAADLAATPDVIINDEIRALAKELKYDPRKIQQYLYENIRFEPYWGAVKGGLATLWSESGGPTDQASLMIGLLRASNIPARYVRGTVRFTDRRARDWIGAKTDNAARDILARGFYPSAATVSGGGLQFSHVWVEACVPYGNYRGTLAGQNGSRWIPLDPSFREYEYQAGIPVNVDLDYDNYMTARTDELPDERFAKRIENAIKTMAPRQENNVLDDVPYKGTLIKRQWDILPNSLPYTVQAFTQWDATTNPTAEAAILPEAHRYQLAISMSGATYQGKLPDLSNKRITVSFGVQGIPANGSLCGVSNVTPKIYVDGVNVAVGGTAVDRCKQDVGVALNVTLPERGATANQTTRQMTATSYAGVIAYAGQGGQRYFEEHANKLQAAIQSATDPYTKQDAIEGEFLHLAGVRYAYLISESARRMAALAGYSYEPGPHLGLSSSSSEVIYVFELPFSVGLRGAIVDVAGSPSRLTLLDDTASSLYLDRLKFFRTSLYMDSAYEHYIWQDMARLDAVSTVRGLQWAAEKGIPVYQFTKNDFGAGGLWDQRMDPSMAGYKSNIQNSLETGGFVRIPKTAIAYTADANPAPWNGIIYEMNNPSYIAMTIQGGFNGGYAFTNPPDISSLYDFSNYNSFFPQSLTTYSSTLDAIYGIETALNGFSFSTTIAGDPVNMLTGNMYHTERDVVIKGRGDLPFVFERTYNSRDPQDGPLGFGWTHSFNHTLKFFGVEGGKAKVSWVNGSGSERFYSTSAHTNGNISLGAVFDNPPGVYTTFKRNNGGAYSIREKNGITYTFESKTAPNTPPAFGAEPKARLIAISDANGNVLSISYAAWPVVSVTDGAGRTLLIKHNAAGRIIEVGDWTGRKWIYGYDTAGNLNSFKNPLARAGKQNPVTYSYYSDARLNHVMKKYTLPRGNSMTFEYYLNGRVLKHTNAKGESTSFSYNQFRRESTSVNERGYPRTYFFDKDGNLEKLVEENGAERRFVYDPDNPFNKTAKYDPNGYLTTYEYNSRGDVTKETSPSGAATEYSYFNDFAKPGMMKTANGVYSILKYDAKGNLTDSIVLKSGRGAGVDPQTYVPGSDDIVSWTQRTYTPQGDVKTMKRVRDFVSGNGPTLTMNYDAKNLNVVSIQRCGDKDGDGLIGGSECDVFSDFAYDAVGRETKAPNKNWYLAQSEYDDLDRVTRATDRVGNWRDFQYDENGNFTGQQLVQIVNGRGQLRDGNSVTYDMADRRASAVAAGGFTTQFSYDAAGNVVKVLNPDGYAVWFDFDPANRRVRSYDAEGNSVYTSFDLDGKPRSITSPDGTAASYDYYGSAKNGLLERITDPGGRTTTFDYDASGNRISVTDSLGKTSLSFYDELNRLWRTVGPAFTDRTPGSPTANQMVRPVMVNRFDNLGNTKAILAGYTLDATGQNSALDVLTAQANFEYDDFGQKIAESDAFGRRWKYKYDLHGNLIESTDPKSQRTQFSYGYGGLLFERRDNSGQRTSYVYNPRGQMLNAQNPDATYAYDYDSANRLSSVTDSQGNKSTYYQWTPGGKLSRRWGDDIPDLHFNYDASGRLISQWDERNTSIAYQYNEVGKLSQKRLPGDIATEYEYYTDGSLKRLSNVVLSPTRTVLSEHQYVYDSVGLKQSTSEQVGAFQGAIGTETFAFDALNNRTQRTAPGVDSRYVYDSANQLTQIRSSAGALTGAMIYDAVGNVVKKCWNGTVTVAANDCDGANTLVLVYDALNRLMSADKRGAEGGVAESYAYDDQGRRIRKTTNGQATYYRYDGAHIVAEYKGDRTQATALYINDPGVDRPVARYEWKQSEGRYERQLYQADGFGSVVGITDETGRLVGSQMFDAWGNRIASQSSGKVPTYGFTGRESDDTGLMYYRARYYDPSLGRFTQKDPIGYYDGLNLYAYVGNDPLNVMDPSGLVRWKDLGWSLLGMLGNGAGIVTGSALVGAGGALVIAPEPILTKVVGVGGVALGSTIYTKSTVGFALNLNNMVDAFKDQPASMPSSAAAMLAEHVAPGNQTVAAGLAAADLALDLAGGRLPIAKVPANAGSALAGETLVDLKTAQDIQVATGIANKLPGVSNVVANGASVTAANLGLDVLQGVDAIHTAGEFLSDSLTGVQPQNLQSFSTANPFVWDQSLNRGPKP